MNTVYLFPFSEVPRGSRIAIYGMGMVGMGYIDQLQSMDYLSIALIIDRNGQSFLEHRGERFPVVSPSQLKINGDVDFFVTATINDSYREEMVDSLTRKGVDPAKIITRLCSMPIAEKTYSQHGEDLIIYNAFKHMGFFRDGRLPSYIDVGAHHPYDLSNTALFHQLGCHGINIEANPVLFKAFLRERPNDVNLCFGIGAEEGEFPFYVSEISGLSTFKKENLAFNEELYEMDTGIKEHYDVKKILHIPVKTLESVINAYCGGVWPEFMSIDIEGMEYDALRVCDFTFGPLLIAVEVNLKGKRFIEMFREKGYFPYLWYRENILFIKDSCEPLVHRGE